MVTVLARTAAGAGLASAAVLVLTLFSLTGGRATAQFRFSEFWMTFKQKLRRVEVKRERREEVLRVHCQEFKLGM